MLRFELLGAIVGQSQIPIDPTELHITIGRQRFELVALQLNNRRVERTTAKIKYERANRLLGQNRRHRGIQAARQTPMLRRLVR